MDIKFKIQGFLRNEMVKERIGNSLNDIKVSFDGDKLDEIRLGVIINNKKDFDDLMDFLQIHVHCFKKYDEKTTELPDLSNLLELK